METPTRPPAMVIGELAASVAARLGILDFAQGWRQAIVPPETTPPDWLKIAGLGALASSIAKSIMIGGAPLSLPMVLESLRRILTSPPETPDETPDEGPSLRVVPSPEDELPGLVLRVQSHSPKPGLRVQWFDADGWQTVAEVGSLAEVPASLVPVLKEFFQEPSPPSRAS